MFTTGRRAARQVSSADRSSTERGGCKLHSRQRVQNMGVKITAAPMEWGLKFLTGDVYPGCYSTPWALGYPLRLQCTSLDTAHRNS